RIEGDVVKGRFPMATGKRKPHDLGTSIGRQGNHTGRQRRPGRAALSGASGGRARGNRKKPADLIYSMLIRWSDEDQVYIATLPEFDNAKTHGATYEKAAQQGRELMESCIM